MLAFSKNMDKIFSTMGLVCLPLIEIKTTEQVFFFSIMILMALM